MSNRRHLPEQRAASEQIGVVAVGDVCGDPNCRAYHPSPKARAVTIANLRW
jgi:hypothetical protein